MNEKIYNETLVRYALRNSKTREYYNDTDSSNTLFRCCKFPSITDAKEVQNMYPEFDEIRKVKVIDIGEV